MDIPVEEEQVDIKDEFIPNKIKDENEGPGDSASLNNVKEGSTKGDGSNIESDIIINLTAVTVSTPTTEVPSPSFLIGGLEGPLSSSIAPETPSVQVKQEQGFSSSESNQFGPGVKLCPNPSNPKIVEVIDLLTSDSETENLEASSEQRSPTGHSSQVEGHCSTLKRNKIQVKAPRKKRKVDAKRISDLDDIMDKLKENSNIIEEYRKIIIERWVTNTAVIPFFEEYGHKLDEIEIITWVWRSDSVSASAKFGDTINLAKVLPLCKNLSSLSLGSAARSYLHCFDDVTLELRNLRFLSFDTGYSVLDKEGPNGMEKVLTTIFQSAENLETLHGKLTTREDLLRILNLMKTSLTLGGLQKLEFLNLGSRDKVPELLRDQDIQFISDMKLKLKALVLGFGLWGNLTTMAFFGMMSSPRLEELNIQGAFQGELNAKTISLDIPPLKNLAKLSIGGDYSFSMEDTTVPKETEIRIEGDERRMPKVEFKLPMLPSLELIRLGSLCYVDRLSPQYFPKLKSLRIGGPWNLSLDFLNESIVFPTVTELQLPDGLKDASFSSRIPSIFPKLKKVWIFLPSGKVLQSFIKALEQQGLLKKVDLFLRSQFDFESTFRACALKRQPGDNVYIQPYEREIIAAINRYKFKDEFLACYNIELPEEIPNPEDQLGYPGLYPLKFYDVDHIPRKIRIPEGRYYWYDERCKFSNYVVGCDNYKSPLNWNCMREFPLGARQCSSTSVSGPEVRIEPSVVRLAQFRSKTETV